MQDINASIVILFLFAIFGPSSSPIKLKNLYAEEIFFYNFQVFIRSFLIAVRYGYISDLRLKLLTRGEQTTEYIVQDLLVDTWLTFAPECIDSEILAALWRNNIEG